MAQASWGYRLTRFPLSRNPDRQRVSCLMAHNHEADESYFLDQIFSIALCGAIGGIAVLLFIKKTMLTIILDPKFHAYVLAGGITLLVLVTIRAVALWKLAGEAGTNPNHNHGH